MKDGKQSAAFNKTHLPIAMGQLLSKLGSIVKAYLEVKKKHGEEAFEVSLHKYNRS